VEPITVLVVDDDPGMRDFVKDVLERGDCVVVTAESGKESLQLTERHRPDVVVLDLNMPDVDGPDVLKQLRQRWPSLPVLILTGFADGELMNRALESGPFTLLAKPCDPDELAATIRSLKHQERSRFLAGH
jgi:DNA-binding response OmpR family regulator